MTGQPPDDANALTGADLEDRLARIWRRSRPVVLERIALLEGLVATADADPAAVAEGRTEAHKLAGLLGTFGIPRGSELAKAVERQLESGRTDGLERPLAELRALVESA